MGVIWSGGYHRGNTVINTGDINIGNTINVGNRERVRNNIDPSKNIYNRDDNRSRNADRAMVRRDLRQARPAANRQNDVFADRDGNVARRANDTWETRENGQWKENKSIPRDVPVQTRERPQTVEHNRQKDLSNANYSNLNRANQSRQRGATRQASRPAATGRAPARRR